MRGSSCQSCLVYTRIGLLTCMNSCQAPPCRPMIYSQYCLHLLLFVKNLNYTLGKVSEFGSASEYQINVSIPDVCMVSPQWAISSHPFFSFSVIEVGFPV